MGPKFDREHRYIDCGWKNLVLVGIDVWTTGKAGKLVNFLQRIVELNGGEDCVSRNRTSEA